MSHHLPPRHPPPKEKEKKNGMQCYGRADWLAENQSEAPIEGFPAVDLKTRYRKDVFDKYVLKLMYSCDVIGL